jgi:hypothetical protein
MDYETLSLADRLQIAKDTLRGRETDHFRISLLEEPQREERLASIGEEIEGIQAVIADLEAQVEEQAVADPEVPGDAVVPTE